MGDPGLARSYLLALKPGRVQIKNLKSANDELVGLDVDSEAS